MKTDNEIRDIISRMSLAEKAWLVTGKNSWRTKEYPQYGIPSLMMSDGTNGIRFQIGSGDVVPGPFRNCLNGSFDTAEALAKTHVATCYPSGSAMASTWDRELLKETGKRLASECKAMGIGMLLGPGMNIRRHPLTARNFEYYSEDPVVSGEMAAAIVEGLQGEGVATSVKHFVCHNSDDRRTRVNVNVSERALREIYLAGFERVVRKAQPATIMTCYNYVNGKGIDADKTILQDIVRKEWGFKGSFITDWGSTKDVAAATEAGLDLQMPYSPASTNELIKDIENGKVSEAALDERVFHVLQLVFRYADPEYAETDQDLNHAQAIKAETEGMVLLRNEHETLPVKGHKLAVIGDMAKNMQFVGSGCAIVKANKVDDPFPAISDYCAEHGIEMLYAQGYTEKDTEPDETLFAEAVKAASEADTVLLFVGTYPPEEGDTFNRTDMRLPAVQSALIEAITAVNPKTAVLVSAGEILVMPWAKKAGAVMDLWFGGEGIGSALVKVLFGEVSPSGKLTVTIPRREADTPAYLNFTSNPYEINYGEDIYVGYRYYEKKEIAPAYPFGHGLSYTSFQYHDACVEKEDAETVTVSVQVTNTGKMDAAEIVQVYTMPLDGKAARPVKELRTFERCFIPAGETVHMTFTLSNRDFCYFDPINHEWANDAENWHICIGASSADIRETLSVTRPVCGHAFKQLSHLAGYHEIFADQRTRDLFFRFLLDHELITPELDNDATAQKLANSFWPVRCHLDMNAQGLITYEMVDELIDRMNEALKD